MFTIVKNKIFRIPYNNNIGNLCTITFYCCCGNPQDLRLRSVKAVCRVKRVLHQIQKDFSNIWFKSPKSLFDCNISDNNRNNIIIFNSGKFLFRTFNTRIIVLLLGSVQDGMLGN